MFQKKIYISGNSFLEVATRIYDNEERIMVTICGPKGDTATTSSSVILTEAHAALFAKHLNDALNRQDEDWPIREE